MAFSISENAKRVFDSRVSNPNIILKFSKVDTKFSSQIVKVVPKYGEGGLVYGQDDLLYGTILEDENNLPYISLNGTSASVNQQIEPDKASTS